MATPSPSRNSTRRARLADFLSLERNVVIASAAVLLIGFGEDLWKKYLPKYLESFGASAVVIGVFGTVRDFFDAIYQYPGGWLSDHVGRRRAFLAFVALASVGWLVYLLSPSWPFVFVGLTFSIAWSSMASPAVFAVIGDSLPPERRAMGFTLQSIVKRIPMAVAPLIGGAIIASSDIRTGVRIGLAITLFLAAVTVVVITRMNLPVIKGTAINMRGVWRSFHHALKRLLISDVIIRTCEGMTEIFLILYVTNVLNISIAQYGILVAIQLTTSIVVYIPAARIAGRIGRKPFVITTFICFALFPVAVVLSTGFASLALAFIVGGLREIGEPSRKAMIVDFAEPHLRARSVGLYYLVRSLSITPAAAIGGLLWKIGPSVPFFTAGVIGLVGVLVFTLTVDEQHAG